jgi:CelD/BcsL family acetyltransferase involved in cellulose biosynthesis
VKTTVCLPKDLGSPELDRWRAIRSLRPDLDNPFLSLEFMLAVGRTRPEARVAVVEDSEKIVAFFPFERRSFGLGVPIGAGLSDCQAIICEADVDLDVHELLAQCGLAAFRFDHLVGTQRAMVAPTAIEGNSPIIDVSAGFDAYLAHEGRRSSDFVRTILRKERKLAREVGPARFSFGASDDGALGRLIAWKSEQYRRTGRPDRFARRSTVQLVRELAKTSEPSLSGTLVTLYAGDRLVAVDFSLRSETTLAAWFPAYDREFSRYSPGAIRTLRTIEASSLAGLHRIDLGKGDEEYKSALKTGDLQVCEGWVVRPGPPRASPPSDERAARDGPRRRAPASPAPPRRPGYARAARLGSAHPRAEATPALGPSIATAPALSDHAVSPGSPR